MLAYRSVNPPVHQPITCIHLSIWAIIHSSLQPRSAGLSTEDAARRVVQRWHSQPETEQQPCPKNPLFPEQPLTEEWIQDGWESGHPDCNVNMVPALVQAAVENKGTIDQTRSLHTIWSNYISKPRALCAASLILCSEAEKTALYIMEQCWALQCISSHIQQQ